MRAPLGHTSNELLHLPHIRHHLSSQVIAVVTPGPCAAPREPLKARRPACTHTGSQPHLEALAAMQSQMRQCAAPSGVRRAGAGPAGLRPNHSFPSKRRIHVHAQPESSLPKHQQQSLHQHLQRADGAIGGYHGEGFTQIKLNGDVTCLDVDKLNEQMRFTGAARLKMVQAPDTAYGLVFRLDHLVADTRSALSSAWASLAQANNLPCPSDTRRLLLHNTCPERIMMDVLGWSRDMKVVQRLSWELSEHYGQALTQSAEPAPGLRNWLELASSYHMPCAAVSSLDRATVRRVLECLHLHDHFQVLVTAEDEHETHAQALLAAAIRLERPPNHCVLFDDCPQGITAAHNVSMKAVAVSRPFCPAWKLSTADVTVSNLQQLSVYNVRRLFANLGSELGDLSKQADNNPPTRKRRITSATL